MAKTLKDILQEVAEPKSGDEKRFKDKHITQDNPYPSKGTDDVLNARKSKKDKTKKTHMSREEEEDMYESADDFDSAAVLDAILDELEDDEVESIAEEEGFVLEAGVLDQLKDIDDMGYVLLDDGTEIEVDVETASAIQEVASSLTDENLAKFEDNLKKDQESFLRMVDFAISMRGE